MSFMAAYNINAQSFNIQTRKNNSEMSAAYHDESKSNKVRNEA